MQTLLRILLILATIFASAAPEGLLAAPVVSAGGDEKMNTAQSPQAPTEDKGADTSSPTAEFLGTATPQRPSISFNTATVSAGAWELEMGGSLSDAVDSIPLFLKYGLTDRTELELGFDVLRRVESPHDVVTSQGDLVFGLRSRLRRVVGGGTLALAGWVKAPTAREDAGNEKFDGGVLGIWSMPLGPLSLDTNLWLSILGKEGGSAVGQVQGVATLGLPGPGGWSFFLEVAMQRTATVGGGGFVDAGVVYSVSRRAVFDAAVGAGWSEGYPDWAAMVGWTILLGGGR